METLDVNVYKQRTELKTWHEDTIACPLNSSSRSPVTEQTEVVQLTLPYYTKPLSSSLLIMVRIRLRFQDVAGNFDM